MPAATLGLRILVRIDGTARRSLIQPAVVTAVLPGDKCNATIFLDLHDDETFRPHSRITLVGDGVFALGRALEPGVGPGQWIVAV
jgi:hypothetical protein